MEFFKNRNLHRFSTAIYYELLFTYLFLIILKDVQEVEVYFNIFFVFFKGIFQVCGIFQKSQFAPFFQSDLLKNLIHLLVSNYFKGCTRNVKVYYKIILVF